MLLATAGRSSYNSDSTERKGIIYMLSENIKAVRKSKGLSQEELAVKLNIVRQTLSKWERGVSLR